MKKILLISLLTVSINAMAQDTLIVKHHNAKADTTITDSSKKYIVQLTESEFQQIGTAFKEAAQLEAEKISGQVQGIGAQILNSSLLLNKNN
jgi:PHD/YefM family antitoxin component YafN of YafNO toxin-antitoxin module